MYYCVFLEEQPVEEKKSPKKEKKPRAKKQTSKGAHMSWFMLISFSIFVTLHWP